MPCSVLSSADLVSIFSQLRGRCRGSSWPCSGRSFSPQMLRRLAAAMEPDHSKIHFCRKVSDVLPWSPEASATPRPTLTPPRSPTVSHFSSRETFPGAKSCGLCLSCLPGNSIGPCNPSGDCALGYSCDTVGTFRCCPVVDVNFSLSRVKIRQQIQRTFKSQRRRATARVAIPQ